MHSSAFPAQLEITCSPRDCHLESGKPIYFPPQMGLVVLVRCRKPINHQRGLGVSIRQEACHLPGLDPHESPAGRGGVGRVPGRRLRGARWGRAGLCASAPPARASFRFDGPPLRSGAGTRASSLGVLIFTSRPRGSYFGRKENYKESSGRHQGGGGSHTAGSELTSVPDPVRLAGNMLRGEWAEGPPGLIGPFPVFSFFRKAG